MLRVMPLLATLLVLTGCGIVPGYRERFEAAKAAQQARIEGADDAQCQGYSANPGSDAYVACRMNLSNQRRADEAAEREAWNGVAQAGLKMMERPPPPPPPDLTPNNHVCVAPNNAIYRCP